MIRFLQKYLVPIVALIPLAVALATLDRASVMWYDELAMCDGVFMKALHGLSWSGVWACSYNPLYPMSLVVWVKLFGASHFSVCSFTLILGYVATLVIVNIAHRRNWWRGVWADLAFVSLFWGGWTFSWILSNARVDVLMLLLTALYADSLAGRRDRLGGLATFCWSALLLLAAPYMLPTLFFFGVFLLVTAEDKDERMRVFKRGLVTAAGVTVGFAITALYYFVQHDLIRLIGSYVYFNTLTGFNPDPFLTRILKGYQFDRTALWLLCAAWVLGAWKRSIWKAAAFVSLIPLLMIVGGRYEAYYSWTFYVPVIVLTVAVVSRVHVLPVMALALWGAACCVLHPIERMRKAVPTIEEHRLCRDYVDRHVDLFKGVQDVVVAADLNGPTGFYYPLSELGVHIWYRGPEMLNGRTDEEKFSEGLSFVARSDEMREKLKGVVAKIQRFMPLLPESGLVMFYSEADVEKILPLFRNRGYELTRLDAEGGLSIWKLEKAATRASRLHGR